MDAKGDVAVTAATATTTKSKSIHDVSAWPSIQVDDTRAVSSQLKNRAKNISEAQKHYRPRSGLYASPRPPAPIPQTSSYASAVAEFVPI